MVLSVVLPTSVFAFCSNSVVVHRRQLFTTMRANNRVTMPKLPDDVVKYSTLPKLPGRRKLLIKSLPFQLYPQTC